MFSRVVPGAALLHGQWQQFLSCHFAIHKMHSCFETCWWLFICKSEVECLILYLFSTMIFAILNLLGHAVWFSNMLKCSPGKAVSLGSSLVIASVHYFQSQVAPNLCETCKTQAKGATDRILIPNLCLSKLLYSSIASFILATWAVLMASHQPFLDYFPPPKLTHFLGKPTQPHFCTDKGGSVLCPLPLHWLLPRVTLTSLAGASKNTTQALAPSEASLSPYVWVKSAQSRGKALPIHRNLNYHPYDKP